MIKNDFAWLVKEIPGPPRHYSSTVAATVGALVLITEARTLIYNLRCTRTTVCTDNTGQPLVPGPSKIQ